MVNACYSTPLQVGRDGQVDLVGIAEVTAHTYRYTNHGLALWRLDASGVVASHTLLGSQVHVQGRPLVSDLNGDGLLDVALVDGNLETGPALVVLIGQSDGVPVLEGRYRLPGTGGTGNEVLAGDLNGDGAADLVVLGRNEEGGPRGFGLLAGLSSLSTRAVHPQPSPLSRPRRRTLSWVRTIPIRLIRPRPSPYRCLTVPRRWT